MNNLISRMLVISIPLVCLLLIVTPLPLAQADTRLMDPEEIMDFQWEPVSESDWSVNGGWCDRPCDAVMIFEKVLDDDRVMYHQWQAARVYTRTRILSERGRDNAVIEFAYVPRTESILDVRARTILRDGRIIELSMKDIMNSERKDPQDEQAMIVSLPYPSADADCIIEYFMCTKTKLPNTPPQFVQRAVQKDIPLELGEYTWYHADPEGPEDNYTDLGLAHYAWSGASAEILNTVTENRIPGSIALIVRNVPAWLDEPKSLPESATRARIRRYYSPHQEPANAFRMIAEEFRNSRRFELSDKDRKKIHEAADRFRRTGDPDETARTVYAWLQDSIINTSYYSEPPAAFFAAIAKRVSKFKDNKKAVDALNKRYGNWDDIEVLFIHLLNDLGIEAWPVLVVQRDENIFVPDAGFWQFSRYISAVRNPAGGFVFCTPGDWGLPYGHVHWSMQTTAGLLCSPQPEIIRTNSSAPETNQVVRTFALAMHDDTSVAGKLFERHHGHKARLCDVWMVGGTPEKVPQALSDSLEHLLPSVSYTLDDFRVDSSTATPLEATYSLAYDLHPNLHSDTLSIAPLLYAPDSGNWFTQANRHGEVMFRYACHVTDTVFLALDSNYRPLDEGFDTVFVNEAGSCTVSFVANNSGLTATRQFIVNKPRFSVSEYPAVRELFAWRATLSRVNARFESASR